MADQKKMKNQYAWCNPNISLEEQNKVFKKEN